MDSVFYFWLLRQLFRALPFILRSLKVNGDLEEIFQLFAEPVPPLLEIDKPDLIIAELRRDPRLADVADHLARIIGEAQETIA